MRPCATKSCSITHSVTAFNHVQVILYIYTVPGHVLEPEVKLVNAPVPVLAQKDQIHTQTFVEKILL